MVVVNRIDNAMDDLKLEQDLTESQDDLETVVTDSEVTSS